MTLLASIFREPGGSNRRLASLTGLGLTKDDENDGVLPTYISYLQAMDLIATAPRDGVRFVLTDIGAAILASDPHAGGRGTIALMAMLLSEPYSGAHLFDWAVRGVMSTLQPFPLDQLKQEAEKLSTDEGWGPSRGNYEIVMRAFVDNLAFGSITPWKMVSSEDLYVPQIPAELETPLFWAIAFMFVRRWPIVFPGTREASLRAVSRELLALPRGVIGIRGRTEEQLVTGLQREGLISGTAVTTERVALLASESDLSALLSRTVSS
jgi:hypothetical protein